MSSHDFSEEETQKKEEKLTEKLKRINKNIKFVNSESATMRNRALMRLIQVTSHIERNKEAEKKKKQ